MKISICQLNILYEDREYNIKQAEDFIKKASSEKSEIVFFPEMSFTGFSMDTDKIGERGTLTVDTIKDYAFKYKIKIGFGWVSKKQNKAENRYTIIDENKAVISDYTKIHPFSYMNEDKYFVGGEDISILKINNFAISTFICYDLRFPEIFQIASKNANIIVVAANWPSARKNHWLTLLKARAIENQVYIVGVNCFGTQKDNIYSGDSCIISPHGDIILGPLEDETLKTIDIEDDVEEYRGKYPFKKDRREDIYTKMNLKNL